MNWIAFVISIVWVRPEPWSGRSDAIRNFALVEPFTAEHDDDGSGVSWLLLVPPEPTAASTSVPVTAASIATSRRLVTPTSSSFGSLRVVRREKYPRWR